MQDVSARGISQRVEQTINLCVWQLSYNHSVVGYRMIYIV